MWPENKQTNKSRYTSLLKLLRALNFASCFSTSARIRTELLFIAKHYGTAKFFAFHLWVSSAGKVIWALVYSCFHCLLTPILPSPRPLSCVCLGLELDAHTEFFQSFHLQSQRAAAFSLPTCWVERRISFQAPAQIQPGASPKALTTRSPHAEDTEGRESLSSQ